MARKKRPGTSLSVIKRKKKIDAIKAKMNPDDVWLTDTEVAAMSGFGVQTIRNWRPKRKNLPYHKIGFTIRYKKADVDEFMEGQRISVK